MTCATQATFAASFPLGAFPVGITKMTIANIDGSGTLPLMVWYPTLMKESDVSFGRITFTAAQDSRPAPGMFGLAVLSHGSGGNYISHWKTAKFLVSHGYIVVSLMHSKDNTLDFQGGSSMEVWSSRPKEWTLALNAVLSSRFGKIVDQTRIAAVGFSAGAYTALVVGGARPSSVTLDDYCLSHPHSDVMCVGFGNFWRMRTLAEKQFGLRVERITAQSDPRIRAIVALAPIGSALFPPHGLTGIQSPVLLLKGDKDRTLRYPNDAQYLKEALGSKAEYLEISGADHYVFMSVEPSSSPPPTEEAKQFADTKLFDVHRTIVDFLNRAIPRNRIP